jgi:mevalonate kinase
MVYHIETKGKIILLGEHSVIYGAPALAIPLKSGISAKIYPNNEIKIKNIPVDNKISVALKKIKQLVPCKGFNIELESQIPVGAGFGASAVFSNLLVKSAVLFSQNKERSLEEISKFTYELEKIFHGNPSGIDNTVVTYEKACLFQKNSLKINPLWDGFYANSESYIFDLPNLPLIIGYSKEKGDTEKMVLKVKEKLGEKGIEKFIQDMSGKFENALSAIKEKDYKNLGDLFFNIQNEYKSIGISTEKIDLMVNAVKECGGYGAKLSGSGGGGCVIALVDEISKHRIIKKWENLGCTIIE